MTKFITGLAIGVAHSFSCQQYFFQSGKTTNASVDIFSAEKNITRENKNSLATAAQPRPPVITSPFPATIATEKYKPSITSSLPINPDR